MLHISVLSNIVLTIIVLAASSLTYAAPTHHLTIGVQGKTPTLIVTSSEIGITPSQTISSNKKLVKTEYTGKYLKNSDIQKKPLKTMLQKNQALFNKKAKFEHFSKPTTKETSSEERLFKLGKITDQFNQNADLTVKLIENSTVVKDQERSTLKFEVPEITTIMPVTPTKVEKAFLHLTTLPAKPITKIPLISTTNLRINSNQPEEMSTFTPQATSDTVLAPVAIFDADNLNIFSDMPTTLNPKDFEDITATTINYNDNTNIVTTSSGVIERTQTQTKANDVVVQTQKTTQNLPDKSVIKMKMNNDNDRHTQEFVARTENRNLLLTTIERNAFVTPSTFTVTSSPTLTTLITEKAVERTTPESLSLSLTMTTTTTIANIVDDNSNNNYNDEEQPATVHLKKSKQYSTQEITNEELRNKEVESPAKPESQNTDVVQGHGEDYIDTTTEAQQSNEEPKTTEYPVKQKIKQTIHDSVFKETTNENPQNQVQTEEIATTKTLVEIQPTLSTEIHKPTFAQFTTNPEYQAETTTTLEITPDKTKPAKTEKVLKLIDLDKQVLKTIGELKQPSLLTAGQLDNGHDGLKKIKKKQLVDKHYVEALLHNKQDLHIKALVTPTAQGTERISTFIPNNKSQSIAVTNKTMLLPIKHGYLGPILMEEKTFHVIHHTGNNMTDRNHHADDIESQLRKGHFVELKVKQEVAQDKTVMDALQNKTRDEKEMLEMQSDQPDAVADNQNINSSFQNDEHKSFLFTKASQKPYDNRSKTSDVQNFLVNKKHMADNSHDVMHQIKIEEKNIKNALKPCPNKSFSTIEPDVHEASTQDIPKIFLKPASSLETSQKIKSLNKSAIVLSTTVFQNIDSVATKTPIQQADTLFTAENKETGKPETESKISDIQIEVYDSTVDSIVASTNFKDVESKQQNLQTENEENYLGKTTKPPVASIQQERFTQYVIDRTDTSTHEPINYNTIRVASGKPEPAAIEIHINVSESFGNESEDVEFSYPQTGDTSNNKNNGKIAEGESYDENKINENIKLKIQSNSNVNGKELENDEILVVEIIDADNDTNTSFKGKIKNTDELFISDVKDIYTTPPPLPPPPPYRTNFERDSDTIFYISNTEVKVGESPPNTNKNDNEERKLRLEAQFFPANYMASTHPSLNNAEDLHPTHHLYEEDIILSPSRNQADSLKIYRNNNEPSPPLDVTYVGESIIEVEQSPGSVITTTYAPDQQHTQADVIIQPAILPEISIGVPVIGELPPQIELKEIDFMPNEAQMHRSGIYDDNDNNNNNDVDENTINGSSNNNNNNNHDVDIVSGNSNNNQRVDESSIQYGGDLIDESADGGFDGVEGSYPFGNPAVVGKSPSYSYSSAFLTKLRKQQKQQQHQYEQQKPNHVADYTHLYLNYGVNNMRKDELSADVKDPGEMLLNVNGGGTGNSNDPSIEQNTMSSSVRDFLRKTNMSNYSMPFVNANATQSERMSNATAFSVMEDVNDLEDKNTEDIVNLISLAIGLFIVILPVVVTCSMFWALRYLYKKYHTNLMDNGGYTDQTETKEPLNENGMEIGEDMSRVARETKMDYNKKGVFVVEVARGIDSKTMPESPVTEGNDKMLSMFDTTQNNGGLAYKMTNEKNCFNNEKVQIHSPPSENQEEGPRSLHQIEELEEPINSPHLNESNSVAITESVFKANTGLSQSDLSSTCSNDSNKGYCYGNQALYVIEQKGYSTTRPNENVVLKYDIKDIKDDDHNPGNDQYLKHSLNKKEELNKTNEDIVEAYKKSEDRESRTSSGESPEQKLNDKIFDKIENDIISENSAPMNDMMEDGLEEAATEQLKNSNSEIKSNLPSINESPTEIAKQKQIYCIPVEIEVHITPAQDENAIEDTILPFNKPKLTEELSVVEETQNVTQPSISEITKEAVDDSVAVITPREMDSIQEDEEIINNNTINKIKDQQQLIDNEAKNVKTQENHCEVLNGGVDKLEMFEETTPLEIAETNKNELKDVKVEILSESINGLETNGNLENKEQEIEKHQDDTEIENDLQSNTKIKLHVNGSSKIEDTKIVDEINGQIFKDDVQTTEHSKRATQSEVLKNGSTTLNDETKIQKLANGHSELECNGNSTHEIENSYDSILSLPEPPPTTDEQTNNYDQQLDTLPPPPPPETFNLKELPPPLTNGNVESPQSEESANFFNTLPPPPPTTLEVKVSEETPTATNGKVHASPLTPPASPPALFTNNLHTGLCSHPIAVDVNGS